MYFTALDIGEDLTKGAVCSLSKKGASILKVFKEKTFGFRKESVNSFEEAVVFLRKIINEIEEVEREATKNIFLGVNGSNIRTYFSKGLAVVSRADNKITADDIEQANKSSNAIPLPSNFGIIHTISQEWNIDGISDIREPLGMEGNRIEVSNVIIAAFMPSINELKNAIVKAGGRTAGFFYNPLASAESLLSKQQKELGVAAVDIGAITTNLIVYEDDKLIEAKTFPIGGRNITKDIAVGLKIPFEIAEKVKIKKGFCGKLKNSSKRNFNISDFSSIDKEFSEKFLGEIIKARLIDIFSFVKESLKKTKEQLPAGIVLSGGTSKILGIEELAKNQLRLSTQIGLPILSNFDIMNPIDQDLISNPEFAVVAGLINLAVTMNPTPKSIWSNFREFIDRIKT